MSNLDIGSLSEGLQNLRQDTLSARIRLEILRGLERSNLGPGDRLPAERELAASLGVSRASLREAILVLQAEGRLIVRHGQGVFVAEPSTQRDLRASVTSFGHSMGELFTMREILEVPAARMATEARNVGALGRVSDALSRLEKAIERDPVDYALLQEFDAQFHLTIAEASGNRFMAQTQRVLNDAFAAGMRTTLEVPGRIAKSRLEHRKILDALLGNDPKTAARAARTHVNNARRAAHQRINEAVAGVSASTHGE